MIKISGVYRIDFDHNESLFYIGSTKNMSERWQRHVNELRRGEHTNEIISRIYAKYGIGDFTFYLIEQCPLEALIEREQYYIDTLNPTVNLCKVAGTSLGVKRSTQWKEKQSKRWVSGTHPLHTAESKKRAIEGRKYRDQSGVNNPMYGKRVPRESIERGLPKKRESLRRMWRERKIKQDLEKQKTEPCLFPL